MGEQRYKVGDWFRVKDNRGAPLDYKVGDVYQVSTVRDDLVFSNKKPGMFAKRFEPWQPRVGERVKVTYPGWEGEGEVTAEYAHGITLVTLSSGKRSGEEGGFVLRDIEPVITAAATEQPATLKIEAGKFYKTRDGRKVGPAFIVGICAVFGNDSNHAGAVWADDGRSSHRGDKLSLKDNDIIAEWIDEPVAKPSNDNAQPKFKVGDRVKRFRGNNPGSKVGHEATISKIEDISGWDEDGPWLKFEDGTSGYATSFNFVAATPTPTTTIVALIENGQPKPSSTPHVHASTGAAEKEAKRLAAKYKGKQFGVFTVTATHEEAAPVYDHKWQNMAALGLKIDAIKELRSITGMGLKPAKDAVEYFLAAA
jgi:hypothetical protein